MRFAPSIGNDARIARTTSPTYSGKRLTGTAVRTSAPGPPSSRRANHEAMVMAVIMKRRAVSAVVQPRAARSTRIARRSSPAKWGRLRGSSRSMRASLMRSSSRNCTISDSSPAIRAATFASEGPLAKPPRTLSTATRARPTTCSSAVFTIAGQSPGRRNVVPAAGGALMRTASRLKPAMSTRPTHRPCASAARTSASACSRLCCTSAAGRRSTR